MYKAIKPGDIPRRDAYKSKRQKELLDFMESGYPAAEVIIPAGEKAETVAAGYKTTARRLGIKTVQVIRRGDRVFLLKVKEEKA